VTCVALMHYAGQSDAIEVPFTLPADPARLGADFVARHRQLYGFATEEPWTLDALRLIVAAPPPAALGSLGASMAGPEDAADGLSLCWFDTEAPVETRRVARNRVEPGDKLQGPLVIEDAWSTVVVPPGSALSPDRHGHLHIEVGEKI
jgi:N-methylhydantoinase A